MQQISLSSIYKAQSVLKPIIKETPLLKFPLLDKDIGSNIFLKCENNQLTCSFKIRGAYFSLSNYLSSSRQSKDIITYSSGNHGIGLAYSGGVLNHPIHVCITHDVDPKKVERLEDLGAIVHRVPNKFTRENFTQNLIDKNSFHLIKPFDEEDVIIANATIGAEINKEEDFDVILIPIGGGGLVSGVGSYYHAVGKSVEIIGLQPVGSPSAKESLKNGYLTELDEVQSVAHSLVVSKPGDITFPLIKKLVNDVWLISDEEIIQAQQLLYNRFNLFVEVSSAIVIAALFKHKEKLRGKKICAILTGSNENPEIMKQ
jgi:threonine dehydratase